MDEEHSDECMDDGTIVSTANDAVQPIVSDSERANEVRSALARSEDNNIVLSAAIQQCYGRSIFMIRTNQAKKPKSQAKPTF
jgi:hypothetical protein